jgi:hypothetical protein
MLGFWLSAVLLAGSGQLPPEVTEFLYRRSQCEHWSGEDPYDASRSAEIETALQDFRCHTVEADEAQIRNRYVRSRAVMKALMERSQ